MHAPAESIRFIGPCSNIMTFLPVINSSFRVTRSINSSSSAKSSRGTSAKQIQWSFGMINVSRSELAKLPPSSIDLILTSPPYFGVSDYVKAQRLSMEWFGHPIEPLRQNEIGARSKRHRNSAVDEYISDLAKCFELAKRSLKPGGACVLIVGESGTRESVLAKVISAVKTVGFELRLDQNRRVSSQRRQTPSIVGEHLLVFSKS
jgi:hypothetical protein